MSTATRERRRPTNKWRRRAHRTYQHVALWLTVALFATGAYVILSTRLGS